MNIAELQRELGKLGREPSPKDVADTLKGMGEIVTDWSLLTAMDSLRRNSTGAGPLEDLLRDPQVSDVVVNGATGVFVDRGAGLELAPVAFFDEQQVRRLATRLAAAAGRRLDDAQPYVDGRLPDGTRLHAVLAPVAAPGTCISLRIPAKARLTLAQLEASGTISNLGVELLQAIIANRVSFLISGGTGSGKTTLLAALIALIPTSERILIVEDSKELNPDHPHCVWLEGRPANAEGTGAIELTTLVKQSLRMRPDRVILGEVRGPELRDLLAALNTGHEGGCGTVHANSVSDVPARLEALAALGGLSRDACHAQVASALQVAIHIHRDRSGQRRLAELGVFSRDSSGLVRVEPALRFEAGEPVWGSGADRLRSLVGLP